MELKRDPKITNRNLEKALAVYEDMKSIDVEQSYHKFLGKIRMNQIKRRRWRILSTAAAVLLLITVGWLLVPGSASPADTIARSDGDIILLLSDGTEIILGAGQRVGDIADYEDLLIRNGEHAGVEYVRKGSPGEGIAALTYSTLTVPRGTQFDIILEDGTHVWLNSNSQLRFPNSFAADRRSVYLEGEAYFEVTPGSVPFLVETRDQTVEVLGTAFNIYDYPEEPSVLTTLVEGSVHVKSNGGHAGLILKPGQQARLRAEADNFTVTTVNVHEVCGWRNGMFIFNDNTLGMVFRKLARWYDFEYRFEDLRTADIVIMGNIPVDLDFAAIVNLINDSKIVDIDFRDNLVTIKEYKPE